MMSLYREQYATFEEYCGDKWGMTKSRANQLVDASMVMSNLTTVVVKPESERQARPLAKLDSEKQVDATMPGA